MAYEICTHKKNVSLISDEERSFTKKEQSEINRDVPNFFYKNELFCTLRTMLNS